VKHHLTGIASALSLRSSVRHASGIASALSLRSSVRHASGIASALSLRSSVRTRTLGFAVLALLPACGSGPDHSEPVGTSSNQITSSASASTAASTPVDGCALNSASGRIHHIIYVQFDNVHFTRTNPNVPSDLEQMPNLLDFITGHGTLLSNHHTPLISHTADDIITSLTGVYGDKHGQPVANSFGFFTPPGSKFFDGFASSFTYWTDPVNTSTDPTFSLITPQGMNAPAPWVPYTRSGCNVGAASIANIEFENVTSDINNVFGPNSPEAAEAKANRTQAIADFEGVAIHCASGSSLCSTDNGGAPDLLPQEPGGYSGFQALFGHKFVAPVISPGGPLQDLDGNVITDGNGNVGFPGFGGIDAAQSLGYVAAMQEHGVPVTFAYISDAHDDHVNDAAFGPGEAGYVAQLAAYDRAWGEFFARLARDGITPENTLFVVTADENDHFAGGPPSPANCDGVNVPCTYAKIGEIDANVTALLDGVDPTLAATPFDIHFDMAPTFYISGNPAPGAPTARAYERAAAQLTAVSPITGNTDRLTEFLADPVEMKLLHMVTGDPQRTPSFVLFGNPDYFFTTSGTPTVVENPGFAWNHGGTNPDIVTTWLGLVGPGVRHQGVDADTWSDHTDIRPTMLALAGLVDDYAHDGVVLAEDLQGDSLPRSLRGGLNGALFHLLASAYKQINAPVGALGMSTLAASTTALAGDDTTYSALEGELGDLTAARDALAAQMIQKLEAAEFAGQALDFGSTLDLVTQAQGLLERARGLAH
jgi:hypothetical protein